MDFVKVADRYVLISAITSVETNIYREEPLRRQYQYYVYYSLQGEPEHLLFDGASKHEALNALRVLLGAIGVTANDAEAAVRSNLERWGDIASEPPTQQS